QLPPPQDDSPPPSAPSAAPSAASPAPSVAPSAEFAPQEPAPQECSAPLAASPASGSAAFFPHPPPTRLSPKVAAAIVRTFARNLESMMFPLVSTSRRPLTRFTAIALPTAWQSPPEVRAH